MGIRPIRFRVESNKSKSTFWYTLVAGNGDTVMTSKAKYDSKSNAKRAAKRQIDALLGAQLVLEYEEADGQWVQEAVEMVVSSGPLTAGQAAVETKTVSPKVRPLPVPSMAPFQSTLNPNT